GRGVEAPLDDGVPLIFEGQVKRGVGRLVSRLDEAELLDGRLQAEADPGSLVPREREEERRRGEEPVAATRRTVAGGADDGGLRGRLKESPRVPGVGREERAEAGAGREEAVRPSRDEAAAAEKMDVGQRAGAGDPRLDR